MRKGISYNTNCYYFVTYSNGDKWRARRKLLTPSFHFRILEDFLVVFNEQAEFLVTILKKFEGKGYIDVLRFITRLSFDVITGNHLSNDFISVAT